MMDGPEHGSHTGEERGGVENGNVLEEKGGRKRGPE